jgi:hypothetical protein
MDNSLYESGINVLTTELEATTDERQKERLINAIEFLKKEHGVEDATE